MLSQVLIAVIKRAAEVDDKPMAGECKSILFQSQHSSACGNNRSMKGTDLIDYFALKIPKQIFASLGKDLRNGHMVLGYKHLIRIIKRKSQFLSQ